MCRHWLVSFFSTTRCFGCCQAKIVIIFFLSRSLPNIHIFVHPMIAHPTPYVRQHSIDKTYGKRKIFDEYKKKIFLSSWHLMRTITMQTILCHKMFKNWKRSKIDTVFFRSIYFSWFVFLADKFFFIGAFMIHAYTIYLLIKFFYPANLIDLLKCFECAIFHFLCYFYTHSVYAFKIIITLLTQNILSLSDCRAKEKWIYVLFVEQTYRNNRMNIGFFICI